MTDILVTMIAAFGSFCFWYFPPFRGYVVMFITVVVGISSMFLLDSGYRIIFWALAAILAPLILGMIYYVFEGSTRNYRLSFTFGHAASLLIIWLMSAGSISYEAGYRATADGEAYRKLQSDFDTYKAFAAQNIENQIHTISELQQRLSDEEPGRAELEAKLSAQMRTHSEDIIRLGDAMYNLLFLNRSRPDYMDDYYSDALKMFQEEDARGNIEASFLMGYLLDPLNHRVKVDSIKQDADLAIQCYEKAALHGHIDAQYRLAELYYKVKEDKEQAAKYYKLAADAGDTKAQDALNAIVSN